MPALRVVNTQYVLSCAENIMQSVASPGTRNKQVQQQLRLLRCKTYRNNTTNFLQHCTN